MKIRIVADSSSDLKTLDDKSIVAVPLKIVTSEKEYVDDNDLDIKSMTDDLAAYSGRSGSACPGTGDWLDAFGDADWIFGITITSNLSGSYNSARIAKEDYEAEHPGKKVYIIDSLSTGPEMRIIVEKIREYVEAGYDFEEICEKIESYKKKTGLVFCLKSMKNLANNGRVSPVIAKMAGLLGIHVVGIASLQGELEQKDKARGEKKALLSILKTMKEEGYAGGKVRIDHCFNLNAAKDLVAMIKAEFKDAVISVGETGGLCSFYAEVGGLLVGFEK